MTRHDTLHPLSGERVTVKVAGSQSQETFELEVEDWWDRVAGESWMLVRVPATILYAARLLLHRLPIDNEVVYGKRDGLGHLVHQSELVEA